MLNKVEKTIEKHKLLQKGDKILIAVSGGADSLALLHCLHFLKDKYCLSLIVAHLNHMFRGRAAERDAEYVEEIAKKLNLEVVIGKTDVPAMIAQENLSPQDAARRARYDFLNRIMYEYNLDKIALGHHMDDQAETVLLHLLQGAGLEGIQAMAPIRDIYIRPLIEIRKIELEEYCEENKLIACQDLSNFKNIYLRNKIRNRLFPWLLSEINPNIVENLAHSAEIFREENKFIEEHSWQIEQYMRKGLDAANNYGRWSTESFIELPLAIQRRFIRKAYSLVKGSTVNLSFTHIEDVRNLVLKKKSNSMIMLPGGIVAVYAYNELIITKKEAYLNKDTEEFYYETAIPGRVDIAEIDSSFEIELLSEGQTPINIDKENKNLVLVEVDPDDILIIRNRKQGDIFRPSGMDGSKKLKDYFIDEKVRKEQRELIPIVLSKKKDKIIWVAGMRVSDEFKYRGMGKVLLKYISR